MPRKRRNVSSNNEEVDEETSLFTFLSSSAAQDIVTLDDSDNSSVDEDNEEDTETLEQSLLCNLSPAHDAQTCEDESKTVMKNHVSEAAPKPPKRSKKNKLSLKSSEPNNNIQEAQRPFFIHIETLTMFNENILIQFLCRVLEETKIKQKMEYEIDWSGVDVKHLNDRTMFKVKTMLRCGKNKLKKCQKYIETFSSQQDKIMIWCSDDGDADPRSAALKKLQTKTVQELQERLNRLSKTQKDKINVLNKELLKQENDKSMIGNNQGKKKKKNTRSLIQEAKDIHSSDVCIINLRDEIKELEDQQQEFTRSCFQILGQIMNLSTSSDEESFKHRISELKFLFAKEVASFENPLPIYKFRTRIQESLMKNNVTILMAETGSGKSTQVAQYLHELDPEMMIVCTQPRKIAAVSLAAHVARQMGTFVGGVVGYKVGSQKKVSKDTRVIFMTDQILVNECVEDPNFTKYQCVILDEVHERSINTDLLLGLTKTGLKNNPHLKLVITSATMNEKLFYDHFRSDETKVAMMSIPGRTFPIEVKWQHQEVDVTSNYMNKALIQVEQILEDTDRGDILVFCATPADTDNLATKLKMRNTRVESLQLHGKLQIDEQRKIFERGHQRRVIFSTNCAETSVTVPGIKYVVDPGVAKEKKFDPVKNSSCLVVQKISQSSAKQRAGRAGRTEPGVCYRLYSQHEFQTMDTSLVPEIKRVQLGLTVLKLIDLGLPRPDLFPFIESPGLHNLKKTIEDLVNLGALEYLDDNNPSLTDLGKKMSKLPLEPRLSKLVLTCNEEGYGEDALILASLCSMAGNVFFRMGNDEDLSKADQKKINFCHEFGDFLTLVTVFKEWSQVDEKKKSKWCVDNFINGKSMKLTRNMVKDLRGVLQKEMKISLTSSDDQHVHTDQLLFNIFQCFIDNLCVYSGHPKLGYINLRTKEVFPLHPSSSFSYLGNLTPNFIIYDQILTTSRTFLLNLSRVEESWLGDTEMELLSSVNNLTVSTKKIKNIGSRIMCQTLIGKKGANLKKLEKDLKEFIGEEEFLDVTCNVEQGFIAWTANERFESFIETFITDIISNQKQSLSQEKLMYSLIENKSRPKVVLGSGGVVDDIILEGEFNDIMIKYDKNCEDLEEYEDIVEYSKNLAGFNEIRNLTKTGDKIVIFNNFDNASEALDKMKQRVEDSESMNPEMIYPLKTSKNMKNSLTGLELRMKIQRRPYKKFGFIKVIDEDDAVKLSALGSFFLPIAITISVQHDKKNNDKKTFYFSLRNYSNIIPWEIENLIKQELQKRKINYSQVFIPLEPAYESSKHEMLQLRAGLINLFRTAVSGEISENDVDVDIRNPTPKTNTWHATARFESSVVGLKVGKYLKRIGADPVHWSQGSEVVGGALVGRREPVHVDFDLRTSFSCQRKIFDILKETVAKTIEEVSNLYPEEKLNLEIKPFNNCQDNDRAVFFLKGTDLTVLARAKDALENILKGKNCNF